MGMLPVAYTHLYTVDIDNLQEAVVNNGHKDIVVKIAMLTE